MAIVQYLTNITVRIFNELCFFQDPEFNKPTDFFKEIFVSEAFELHKSKL